MRRARDTADERNVRISLTPAGVALRQKEKTVRQGILGVCGMSSEELKSLNTQLLRLRDRLDADA